MGDAARDTGELAGLELDHTELGHQCPLAADLVGDLVDVAVAVVERLPSVEFLPLDADLVVLVDAARRGECLRLVLLRVVHHGQRRVLLPQFDGHLRGMRRREKQVLVADDTAQRMVGAQDHDVFNDAHGDLLVLG